MANMHRLTESDFWYEVRVQDGDHDIISRRNALPYGECTRSVCPAHMQQRPPVLDPWRTSLTRK